MTIRRWRLLALILVLGPLAVACSMEETLPPPRCAGGGSELIVAQSVPTAELVPCLGILPDGWTVDRVRVDQDGSLVRLDSDRAGFGAARLLFRRQCDTADAVPVPTDQNEAVAYEAIGRIRPGFLGRRIYVFDGGCVVWEFDFDPDASATLAIDLQARLTLVPRSEINQSIRENFIDEEL
ncbi:MAG: hypothetical protein OER95_14885 [Acidimicrobiia bacterium]|nr:hypothetical protein [Acidimicrobiia bacterium]